MTHDEIEEMLGVYALDALDNDERQEIDDHLVACPGAERRSPPTARSRPCWAIPPVTPQPSHPTPSGTASLPRSRTNRLSWRLSSAARGSAGARCSSCR